jgi:membrane protease YdiL (CAAX protease family)
LLGLVVMCAVFAAYLGILQLCVSGFPSKVPYSDLLFPSLWLLAASAWLAPRFRLSFVVARGGRRILASAILAGIVTLAMAPMAALWPDRSAGAAVDSLVGRVLLVLFVPVAEEFFFRGLLLDRLNEIIKSRIMAAALTSVLFGLAHLASGNNIVVTMTVLSTVLCVATLHTRSLLWPIALHIGWNALAVIRQAPPGRERWIIAGISATVVIALVVRGAHTRVKIDQPE